MNKMILAAIFTAISVSGALAQAAPSGLQNRTIGYVLTNYHWTVNTTADGKQECPQGINDGPREQYEIEFPKDGTKRKVVDTELFREAQVWFPDLKLDRFPYKEAVGTVSRGINLDGKVDADDFTSPEGETGIDNQFFRAGGCVDAFRPGNGLYDALPRYMQLNVYARMLIELTEVDSLENDKNVTVSIYRGLDPMMTDGSGNEYLPYGTMHADNRWDKDFRRQFRGRITNGVLTSDAASINWPMNYAFSDFSFVRLGEAQFKLRVLPERAEGVLAGYIDIEAFHRAQIGWVGTHSISYGRYSAPSVYQAMYRLADGLPDRKTGKNMGISGGFDMSFRQVFIHHDNPAVASNQQDPRNKAASAISEAQR